MAGVEPSGALERFLDGSLVGYTRAGHALRSRDWVALPEGAMAGRRAVVTGATAGIGRAAAVRMAGLGAEVVIVGRDRSRAAETRDEILAFGGRAEVEIADLGLMSEVRSLAARLAAAPEIHVLVNNAGVLLPERRETAEGLEASFAVNLLGHFLLTNLLIPKLRDSAPARIVNVSSGGMYTQRIRVSDLQMERGYDGRKAYARAKRGQVILTEMWAARLRGTGIVVHSMHPGWADTGGVASGIPLFHRTLRPVLRTPEQGADTVVWLAASEEAGSSTGLFWHDRRPRPTHRSKATRESSEDRMRLWSELERLAAGAGR